MRTISLYVILLVLVSCNKQEPCASIDTSLTLTATAEGIRDTLHANQDTIWVTLSIPKFYDDANSSGNLELLNVTDRRFFVATDNLNDFDGQFETVDFKIIDDIGNVNIINLFPFLEFEASEISFDIKFGIVPLQVGSYKVSLGGVAIEPHLSFKRVGTECSRRVFDISFNLNNNSEDNNYHVVEDSEVPEYSEPNYTSADFNKSGSFAFVVKE